MYSATIKKTHEFRSLELKEPYYQFGNAYRYTSECTCGWVYFAGPIPDRPELKQTPFSDKTYAQNAWQSQHMNEI